MHSHVGIMQLFMGHLLAASLALWASTVILEALESYAHAFHGATHDDHSNASSYRDSFSEYGHNENFDTINYGDDHKDSKEMGHENILNDSSHNQLYNTTVTMATHLFAHLSLSTPESSISSTNEQDLRHMNIRGTPMLQLFHALIYLYIFFKQVLK